MNTCKHAFRYIYGMPPQQYHEECLCRNEEFLRNCYKPVLRALQSEEPDQSVLTYILRRQMPIGGNKRHRGH